MLCAWVTRSLKKERHGSIFPEHWYEFHGIYHSNVTRFANSWYWLVRNPHDSKHKPHLWTQTVLEWQENHRRQHQIVSTGRWEFCVYLVSVTMTKRFSTTMCASPTHISITRARYNCEHQRLWIVNEQDKKHERTWSVGETWKKSWRAEMKWNDKTPALFKCLLLFTSSNQLGHFAFDIIMLRKIYYFWMPPSCFVGITGFNPSMKIIAFSQLQCEKTFRVSSVSCLSWFSVFSDCCNQTK